MDGQSRERFFSEAFEQLFPGYKENVLKTLYMKWPKDPWAFTIYPSQFPASDYRGPFIGQPHMGGRCTSLASTRVTNSSATWKVRCKADCALPSCWRHETVPLLGGNGVGDLGAISTGNEYVRATIRLKS